MTNKIIAGLGGAIALNLLHEVLRKTCKNVPHINEVGEEAMNKALDKVDMKISDPDRLYAATMAGDVVSNAIYYATTGTSSMNIGTGLLAGLGAVNIPSLIGLDDAPVASTDRKKILTVGYYLFGALVTKWIYKKLNKDNV